MLGGVVNMKGTNLRAIDDPHLTPGQVTHWDAPRTYAATLCFGPCMRALLDCTH